MNEFLTVLVVFVWEILFIPISNVKNKYNFEGNFLKEHSFDNLPAYGQLNITEQVAEYYYY